MKKVFVQVLDGVTPKNVMAPIVLSFDQNYFIIEEMGGKIRKPVPVTTYKIPLENLLDTLLSTEKEIEVKSKSVVGRGVAGGLLFGPVGLFLGGLSGVGNKQKSKTRYLYVVSYRSQSGEINNVTFSVVLPSVNDVRQFDSNLRASANLDEEENSSEIFL